VPKLHPYLHRVDMLRRLDQPLETTARWGDHVEPIRVRRAKKRRLLGLRSPLSG
jgi:hypothetical protein